MCSHGGVSHLVYLHRFLNQQEISVSTRLRNSVAILSPGFISLRGSENECVPERLCLTLSLPLSLYSQVIILIGNKADLEAQRDVTYEEAKQFAEENGETDANNTKMSGRREKF